MEFPLPTYFQKKVSAIFCQRQHFFGSKQRKSGEIRSKLQITVTNQWNIDKTLWTPRLKPNR
jgi:hypothetical protein